MFMLRKTAIVISAALVLTLFSACGTEGVKTSDEAPALSAEPGGVTSTEPEDLPADTATPASGDGSTYLTDAKFDTEETLPNYDANNDFFNYRILHLAETDDVYYYHDHTESFIMLYDKASGITTPLCDRPECSHDSASCNAYVGYCMGLSLYDGQLYTLAKANIGELDVSRMSLDGTERREVRTIMCPEWSGSIIDFEAGIHRGELYCAGEVQTVRDGETYERMLVKAYALDEDRDVTIFDEYYKGNGVFDYRLNFAGTHLYITVRTQNNNNNGVASGVTAYDWDIKTHTLTTVASVAEEDIGHINGFYTSADGETYILCDNGNEEPTQRHCYIYGYDAETRKFVRRAEIENSMFYIENEILLGAVYGDNGETDTGKAYITDTEGKTLYVGNIVPEGFSDGITPEYSPYLCGGNKNAVIVAQNYKSADDSAHNMWLIVDLGGEEPPKLLYAR